MKMGNVSDFGNFMGAVIDASSFKTQKAAIDEANAKGSNASVLVGGGYDDSDGWFVEPTVIETTDPDFRTMKEELFGPVVTAYVYDEKKYEDTLDLIDAGAPYGLTGAVFSRDRDAVATAQERLRYAAGNFYVNDKPTGAVVGQQPFGGARASGTNDKAGSMWNLIRWVSPADDQGDVRPADGLPLPVPRAGSRLDGFGGLDRGDDLLERGPAGGERLDVGDRADEELLVPRVLAQVVLDQVERHAWNAIDGS